MKRVYVYFLIKFTRLSIVQFLCVVLAYMGFIVFVRYPVIFVATIIAYIFRLILGCIIAGR